MPHFYYFYYPFYAMGDMAAFYSITMINFFAIGATLFYSDKVSTEFGIITKVYLIYEAIPLGTTTNIDPLLYFIFTFVWFQAKKKNFRFIHLFLLSFFIFKPTLVVLFLIIGYEQKKYKFWEYLLISAAIIGLLNLPIIIIRLDIFLCTCFYQEYLRNLEFQVGGDYDDLSFMAPLLYLIYSFLKKLKVKPKYRLILFGFVILVIFQFIVN